MKHNSVVMFYLNTFQKKQIVHQESWTKVNVPVLTTYEARQLKAFILQMVHAINMKQILKLYKWRQFSFSRAFFIAYMLPSCYITNKRLPSHMVVTGSGHLTRYAHFRLLADRKGGQVVRALE